MTSVTFKTCRKCPRLCAKIGIWARVGVRNLHEKKGRGIERKTTRTIVSFIALDKAPAVDVDNLAPSSVLAAQHIEATHALPEAFTYFIGPRFLFGREAGDEPGLGLRCNE